jgi:hypothetical protein
MDERLGIIAGVRPGRLLRSHLPDVARAIVQFSTGSTQVAREFLNGLEYVRFDGATTVVVLAEDWDRILPYIRDGYFMSSCWPTPRVVTTGRDDPSLEASPNRALYDRVLATLQVLFPSDYP